LRESAQGHARTPARRRTSGNHQPAHHPPSLPFEGFEQFQHPLVVGPLFAGQVVGDQVAQVVVANGNRVRISEAAVRHRSGCPHPDPGEQAEPSLSLERVEFRKALETLRAKTDLPKATPVALGDT